MRRLIVGIIALLLALIPLMVYATNSIDASTNAMNQESLTATSSIENESKKAGIIENIIAMLKTTPTYISIFTILIGVIFYVVSKKEVPLFGKIILPVLFVLVLFTIRILMLFKNADFWITIFLAIVYAAVLVAYLKNSSHTFESKVDESNSSKKDTIHINRYTERLLNKSHSSIKGIQVFSVEELIDFSDQSATYDLTFLGGKAKTQTNINTLFSGHIVIPNSLSGKISVIKQIQLGVSREENKKAICAFASDAVAEIQKQLNEIEDVNSITIEDCYKARIMLMILSYWASCDKPETPFVGVEEKSLGLQNKDIETALFTYTRSGVLGPLLIEDEPYVFSYRRNTFKKGRFYFTFSCGKSKRFVVFITIENNDHDFNINERLKENLLSIQKKLTQYLVKDKEA